MTHNPFAPPTSRVDDIAELPLREDYGFKLSGSLLWRVLILQTLLAMPLVGLLVLLEWPSNVSLIKLKPSLIYAAVALQMAVAMLAWSHGALFKIWGKRVRLPVPAWRRLSWLLLIFYIVLAVVNVAIAFFTSTAVWVQYKAFGPLLGVIAFCVVAPRLLPRPNPSFKRTGLRPAA